MGSRLVGTSLGLKASSRLSYRDARSLETFYDFAPSFCARSSNSLFGDSDGKDELNPTSNSHLVEDERDGRSSHLPAPQPQGADGIYVRICMVNHHLRDELANELICGGPLSANSEASGAPW